MGETPRGFPGEEPFGAPPPGGKGPPAGVLRPRSAAASVPRPKGPYPGFVLQPKGSLPRRLFPAPRPAFGAFFGTFSRTPGAGPRPPRDSPRPEDSFPAETGSGTSPAPGKRPGPRPLSLFPSSHHGFGRDPKGPGTGPSATRRVRLEAFPDRKPPDIRRPRRCGKKQGTSRQEKGRRNCRAKPAPKGPRALHSARPNPLLSPKRPLGPPNPPNPESPEPICLPSLRNASPDLKNTWPGDLSRSPDSPPPLAGVSTTRPFRYDALRRPGLTKKVRPLPRQRARRFLPGRVRKMVGSFEDSRRIPPAGTGAPGECPIDMKTILDKTLAPSQEQMGGVGAPRRRGIFLSGQRGWG